MAISNINPLSSTVINPGDSFSFDIDNTYTRLIIQVETSSGTETAYDTDLGGAQAGYVVAVEEVLGVQTFTLTRDTGWGKSPFTVTVTEDEASPGTFVTTDFSYFLTGTLTYPEGQEPYFGDQIGNLNVTEGNLSRRSDVGWIDFDDATFDVTDSGPGKVTVTGLGGGGGSAIEVEDEGVSLTTDVTKFNFVGAGVTATAPVADQIEVSIPGGGSDLEVEDEGVSLSTAVTKINFVGDGVTATSPAADEIEVSVQGGGARPVEFHTAGFIGGQTVDRYYTWPDNTAFETNSQWNNLLSNTFPALPGFDLQSSGPVVAEDCDFTGGRVNHMNFAGGNPVNVTYEVWRLPAVSTVAPTPTLLGSATIADDSTANKNYTAVITPTGTTSLTAGDRVAVTVRKDAADGGAGARSQVTLNWGDNAFGGGATRTVWTHFAQSECASTASGVPAANECSFDSAFAASATKLLIHENQLVENSAVSSSLGEQLSTVAVGDRVFIGNGASTIVGTITQAQDQGNYYEFDFTNDASSGLLASALDYTIQFGRIVAGSGGGGGGGSASFSTITGVPEDNANISAFGASLIDDADASAARTTLGLSEFGPGSIFANSDFQIDGAVSATDPPDVLIRGGASAGSAVKGGPIYIAGGASFTGTADGGDVYIYGGAKAGTGANGNVLIGGFSADGDGGGITGQAGEIYLLKGFTINDSTGAPVTKAAASGEGQIWVQTDGNVYFRYEDGSDERLNTAAKNSIEIDADEFQLVNDAASPGNSQYYGTDGAGVKGYHALPSGGGGNPKFAFQMGGALPNSPTADTWYGPDDRSGFTGDQLWSDTYGTAATPTLAAYVKNPTFKVPFTGQITDIALGVRCGSNSNNGKFAVWKSTPTDGASSVGTFTQIGSDMTVTGAGSNFYLDLSQTGLTAAVTAGDLIYVLYRADTTSPNAVGLLVHCTVILEDN